MRAPSIFRRSHRVNRAVRSVIEQLETRRLLSVDFTQGANGDANNSPPLGDITWINGILNPNNSEYFEGVSTLQRVYFDSLSGNSHSLVFDHEAARGSTHAYDFLTSWSQAVAATNAIAPGTLVDPTTDGPDANTTVEECEPGSASPANFTAVCDALHNGGNFIDVQIPDNMTNVGGSSVASRISAYEGFFGNRTVRIWGNAPITAGSMTFDGYTGNVSNKTAMYHLNWTSASTQIIVEFGAHLAQGNDFTLAGVGYGAGKGAGSISGGPYHVSLLTLDGASLGSQDNQIQANAVSTPPDFTIDKTGDTLSKITDDVNYTVTIVNTGGIALYPQSITDTLKGTLSASSFTESGTNNDVLDAGETWTLSYKRTVQAGDADPLVNTVTAIFDTSSTLLGIDVTRSDSVTTNLFQPKIDLVKSADKSAAAVGDVITYTYTLQNTGSSDSPALVNVVLKDDNGTPGDTSDDKTLTTKTGDDGDNKLEAGETWTYTYKRTVASSDSNPLVNIATVHANPENFTNDITDTDTASVAIFTPSISIDKSGPSLSKIGDSVTYTYDVKNTTTGATPGFSNVKIVDDAGTPGSTADDFTLTTPDSGDDGDGILEVGETWKFSKTITVPAGATDPFVNTAVVSASVVGSSATVSNSDSFSVNLFQPGITVDKTLLSGTPVIGNTLTYQVVITNTSSSDAPDLIPDSISDSKAGAISVSSFTESGTDDNKLNVGETWTVTYTYTILQSDFPSLTNTVTAHFHPASFPNDIKGSDSVTTPVGIPEKMGRMTGGGSIFLPSGTTVVGGTGTRVTHGFELHCKTTADGGNNHLEVNWGKPNQHFHLSSLDAVKCEDNPLINQAPPVAPIDTLIGQGSGFCSGTFKGKKYSKADANISFIFIDAGEPGTSDTASYIITVLNGAGTADDVIVLDTGDADGVRTESDLPGGQIALTKGNHQAHNEIGTVNNTAQNIESQILNTFNQLDNVNLTQDKIDQLTQDLLDLFAQYEQALVS